MKLLATLSWMSMAGLWGCYERTADGEADGDVDVDADADSDADADADADGDADVPDDCGIEGAWSYEGIVAGQPGMGPSAAIDAAGTLHVAYHDEHNAIFHASNGSGAWQSDLVDPGGEPYGSTRVAVDGRGVVHVAYPADTSVGMNKGDGVRYATQTADGWVLEDVDSGSYPALFIDGDDVAHITYYDYVEVLRHATNASGTWVSEDLPLDGGTDRDTSVAVDAAGRVHVSYNRFRDHALELGYSTNASGSWVTEVLTADGALYNAIAVLAGGTVHIAYGDSSVHHATNRPGEWAHEVVDADGGDISLALDDAGHAQIAYCSGDRNELRVAAQGARGWVLVTVDDVGCQAPVLVLAEGVAHVVYECGQGGLCHAWTESTCEG